jgi:predicted PurR-regulated permease PerM
MVINALFPQNLAKSIIDEFAFIDKTFVGFFAGKILDSAIIGLICYVFCLILQLTMGLHNAVLIAVIVGVTNVIPYFGPYIGGIPAALLVLMDSPAACVIFVVFIILLQQFDGNFLGPLLLSGSVGLSGFWVLFSITLFGGLMGFVGILIGVPVFAVIYDLIKRFIHYMLRKRKLETAKVK